MSVIRRGLFCSLFTAVCVFNFSVPVRAADVDVAGVVSGQVSVNHPDAQTTRINVSDNAIVNCNDFGVAAGNWVDIQHTTAGAASLWNVVGPNPSAIYGRLTSNGNVFLINPNGILFGRNAQVDAPGLVASTLNIPNDDFLAGRYRFVRQSAGSGAALPDGAIQIRNGGFLALLLSKENKGLAVEAPVGRVAYASGDLITLGLDDANDIAVVTSRANYSIDPLGGSGKLADVGDMVVGRSTLLTATTLNNVLDALVRTDLIKADTIRVEANGEVYLGAQYYAAEASTTNGSRVNGYGEGTIWKDGSITATGHNDPSMTIGGTADYAGMTVTAGYRTIGADRLGASLGRVEVTGGSIPGGIGGAGGVGGAGGNAYERGLVGFNSPGGSIGFASDSLGSAGGTGGSYGVGEASLFGPVNSGFVQGGFIGVSGEAAVALPLTGFAETAPGATSFNGACGTSTATLVTATEEKKSAVVNPSVMEARVQTEVSRISASIPSSMNVGNQGNALLSARPRVVMPADAITWK